MKKVSLLFSLLAFALFACSKVDGTMPSDDGHVGFTGSIPRDFPPMPIPAENPLTDAKVRLGRFLFFDKRLSRDSSTSCGSCHKPERAFADTGRVSFGFQGLPTEKNSTTLTNVGYVPRLFAEGGVPSLERQVLAPILAHNEFNMTQSELEARLSSYREYRPLFREAFGTEQVTLQRVMFAIASFERTILSGNSAFDRWNRGDNSALSLAAQRGEALFFGETGDCWHCHNGFNFTTNTFHNIGLDSNTFNQGRILITGNPNDEGKFKVPTLRNVALTAPYMHDGRFRTLEEVVRHYNSGGKPHPQRDPLMRPLGLSEQDISDLVEFLKSLTDTSFTQNPSLQNPWQP